LMALLEAIIFKQLGRPLLLRASSCLKKQLIPITKKLRTFILLTI
jgi:hypothetical protein